MGPAVSVLGLYDIQAHTKSRKHGISPIYRQKIMTPYILIIPFQLYRSVTIVDKWDIFICDRSMKVIL